MATLIISSDNETVSIPVNQSVADFLAADGERWPTRKQQVMGAYVAARAAAQANRKRVA